MAKLYLIPTPLSENSIHEVLTQNHLDIIVSIKHFVIEEIRTARRFLRKAGYTGNFDDIAFFELNEHTPETELPAMLAFLKGANIVGLLSEAGIPCVADPGAKLVRLAHQNSIQVIPLSGPSSIFMALMASGFNGQQFRFLGYLPIEKEKRLQAIKSLEKEAIQSNFTQIFIETPYRNQALIQDIIKTCHPDTLFCVASELTSKSENIISKSIKEWKNLSTIFQKTNCVFLISK